MTSVRPRIAENAAQSHNPKPMANKLFAVEITYKAYVLAEDYFEAQDFASDITDTEDPAIDAHEVRTNFLGWHPESLVYHNSAGDITLREALEAVK